MFPLKPGREMPTKLRFSHNVALVEPFSTPQGIQNQNASLDSWEILRLKSKMPGAKFFVTAGNTMCVCKDAQQVDVVVWLPMRHSRSSASVPWSEAWILRHAGTSGCYRVIGPAIVAGSLQPGNHYRQRLDNLQHLCDPETVDLV